jgi:hypothetical protein
MKLRLRSISSTEVVGMLYVQSVVPIAVRVR